MHRHQAAERADDLDHAWRQAYLFLGLTQRGVQ